MKKLFLIAIIATLAGCANILESIEGNGVKTEYDTFSETKTVSLDGGLVRDHGKTSEYAARYVNLYWTGTSPEVVRLTFRREGGFEYIKSAALKIDGRQVELEKIGVTDHDIGDPDRYGSRGSASEGHFFADLNTVRSILDAREALLRVSYGSKYVVLDLKVSESYIKNFIDYLPAFLEAVSAQ